MTDMTTEQALEWLESLRNTTGDQVCAEIEAGKAAEAAQAFRAALEAAREDAERLAFLASEPVVEGFVGVEKDIYDYAFDAAEESGHDEPNEADMLTGLRRMIDAAMQRTSGGDHG